MLSLPRTIPILPFLSVSHAVLAASPSAERRKPATTPRLLANLKLHPSSGASVLVEVLLAIGHRQSWLRATLWFAM